MTISNKAVGNEAMKIAETFELQEGRATKRVDRDGVGYDLHAIDIQGERFIEVKGFAESWATHDWQSLYQSQVKLLKAYPEKFFLYMVHFDKENFPNTYQLFAISGAQLLSDGFRLEPESFRLSPISQRKLKPYAVSVEKSVVENRRKVLQHD